jgi:diguanylate cyclase (GGDEF)-like protein
MLDVDVPAIIMTGNYDEKHRDHFFKKNIIDYVLKDSSWCYGYLITLANRLLKNKKINVLVVDDSRSIRKHYLRLLSLHNYNVIEAENGVFGLKQVKELGNNIKLIITDYNMPAMDGFGLVNKVRELYSKDEIAIIGLSNSDDPSISAKFLKLGANDYLSKGFIKEEFYARVTQNLDNIELIEKLKDIAMKDHLTTLYNRHYFYEFVSRYFNKGLDDNLTSYVTMIDLDHFKNINDTYGHQAGDIILKEFSKRIKMVIENKLINVITARFGGEEFIVFCRDRRGVDRVAAVFEEIREYMDKVPIKAEGTDIKATISIGVHKASPDETYEEAIKKADDALYTAKETGRNQVIIG